MATSWNDQKVLCPFYVGDATAERWIKCCGLIPGSTLRSRFETKADFEMQLNTFCCEYYKNCEIYRMLMQQWEDE